MLNSVVKLLVIQLCGTCGVELSAMCWGGTNGTRCVDSSGTSCCWVDPSGN